MHSSQERVRGAILVQCLSRLKIERTQHVLAAVTKAAVNIILILSETKALVSGAPLPFQFQVLTSAVVPTVAS